VKNNFVVSRSPTHPLLILSFLSKIHIPPIAFLHQIKRSENGKIKSPQLAPGARREEK
jgi:hypothetical protein